jgi:hypothetical protein
MIKGKKEEKKRENTNSNSFMKGGLVMSRNILAGLVVLALFFACSAALADSGNPLSYQIMPSKSANEATVKVYLNNSEGLAGASIPLSFASIGSDIQCTAIDFQNSRVSHFKAKYPQIDNMNKRVMVGLVRDLGEELDDVLPAGEGLLFTLRFVSEKDACRPELKIVAWPLSAGEVNFNLVGSESKSFYTTRGKQLPIAISQIGDGGQSDPVLENNKAATFKLERNFPNPFNPETIIKFNLPEASRVSLNIYNVLGQVVRTLVNEELPAGLHSVVWDGKNEQASDVASGVYFYRIKAGDFESTMRMTLLR